MKTQIDDFTEAYIECALWSSCDDNDEPLDSNYSIDDIEPESLEKIIGECKLFKMTIANYCKLIVKPINIQNTLIWH